MYVPVSNMMNLFLWVYLVFWGPLSGFRVRKKGGYFRMVRADYRSSIHCLFYAYGYVKCALWFFYVCWFLLNNCMKQTVLLFLLRGWENWGEIIEWGVSIRGSAAFLALAAGWQHRPPYAKESCCHLSQPSGLFLPFAPLDYFINNLTIWNKDCEN